MNLQRLDFLLLVAIAAAAAIPVAGQMAAAAQVTPALANAASISDFSGFWAHPGLGFEPPVSGPGPVRNKSRLPNGASNFDQLVGDYTIRF